MSRSRRRRHWMHRLGRVLAMVTQLVLLLAPIAEGREERLLDPHVEAPRTKAHPGHQPTTCAECVLLSMHGRAEERSHIAELLRTQGAGHVSRAMHAIGVERAPSNTSRAPPLSV
ncbi:MAG: hypothetical protein ABI625_07465 [bacterium]